MNKMQRVQQQQQQPAGKVDLNNLFESTPQENLSYNDQENIRQKQLEEQRKRFYQAMSDTLKEDQDGHEYGLRSTMTDHGLDEFGRLTVEFKDELRELKEEELIKFEETIKNARPPSEDIFGIKRRFCTVCEQGCIGYEANSVIIPNGDICEFPTFCKNCKCPAHFHTVCFDPVKDLVFPPELVDSIKDFNIQSKDVNFNCIVVAFQVREAERYIPNMNELRAILREEGLEILQQEKRELDVEEAIYIKSRMIGQGLHEMSKVLGISHTNLGGKSNLRQEGFQGSSVQTKQGAKDPYLMNVYADEKELKLQKMQQTLVNQIFNKKVNPYEANKTQMNEGEQKMAKGRTQNVTFGEKQNEEGKRGIMMESINQRVPLTGNRQIDIINDDGTQSIARTSNADSMYQPNKTLDQLAFSRRETVLPRLREKILKLKTFSKSKTQAKKTLVKAMPEEGAQEIALTREVVSNPLVRELITKEVVIVALSSSIFQNLQQKFKNDVLTKIEKFLPAYEMPLLYISENKILALEDAITFFPSMFKLTKSIIVTEPLFEFSNATLELTTQTQLQLRASDPAQKKFNEKLTGMMKKIEENEEKLGLLEDPNKDDLENEEDDSFMRNRKTLIKKISIRVKNALTYQETLAKTKKITGISKNSSIPEWAERARNRENDEKKKKKLLNRRNKNLFNYGIMLDFFNYSAMNVQHSLKGVEFNQQLISQSALDTMKQDLKQFQNQSNIFAIAKIGLSNLIFPNSLDVKLSNYNNFPAFIRLGDLFFPEISTAQHSVLILRPIIVKNGLNEVFVQILKVNDFTIIKRKVRMLSKSEVVYLGEMEKITKDKAEMYYNLMMDADCEIIVVSKLGAVEDLKCIVDGSKPHGRRRIPQLYEDQTSIRSNVDSINGIFEITPFTSFSEFLDLENFIVSHTKLDKYKKLWRATGRQEKAINRIDDQLYYYKIETIRKELNLFSRYFNLVAYAAPTHYEAQQNMCVLMPEVATIEESVIILNPIYTNYFEAARKLLERMGFRTIKEKIVSMSYEEVEDIFVEKLSPGYERMASKGGQTHSSSGKTFSHLSSGEKIIEFLGDTQLHVWHLFKVSGDREIRQLYKDSQIEYEDLFQMKIKKTPFKPSHFPYLFIFMDTPLMFEESLKLLWPIKYLEVTGQDFIDTLNNQEKLEILELALLGTLGDKIKHLSYDRKGNILLNATQQELEEQRTVSQGITKIPQLFQLLSNPKGNHAVHFLVESEGHGLYEIRFQRLPHKGDYYSQANDSSKVNLKALKMRYFTKFQILNFYYNEVNRKYYNTCPAFYRFKICPLVANGPGSSLVNRVFEVEEYMGKMFLEDLGNMHQDHLRMVKQEQKFIGWQQLTEEQQKSLPTYIWGFRLAQMCKELETIKGEEQQELIGAGRIKFEKGQLTGQVVNLKDYYEFDKKRYLKYLESFKQHWNNYLSALDCDLIEQKLLHILNSVTFKYSRQQSFISLIPDRITEANLRISEKVKFVIPESLEQTSKEKFFTHLKEDLVNAHFEENATNQVKSILHTLHIANTTQILDKKRDQKFSLHKDCALVGVEVARRPKYQLIASILYLFNFWFRKIERKTYFFEDIERQAFHKYPADFDPEKDYDMILDIVIRSIQENYGEDEYNLALDLNKLQNDEETEFDQIIRERKEREARIRERINLKIYEQQRLMRTKMSIEQLIETQCIIPAREYEMKQRELLQKFVNSKGCNDFQSDGFFQLLKDTQTYLGPYSIKLAHDYLKRFEKQEKSKQELISFVKMEYFLFGVSEAYRTQEELNLMKSRINQVQDDIKIKKQELSQGERQTMTNTNYQSSLRNQGVSNKTLSETKLEAIDKLTNTLEQLSYQISAKETELVLQFREILSWEYHVPDNYFDIKYMMQKKNFQFSEAYQIPFKTFWRPIYYQGYYEPDLTLEKFALKARDYNSKDFMKSMVNIPKEDNESDPYREGALISYLRPYNNRDPSDFLKFDRYYSLGEWKQNKELTMIRDTQLIRKS